MRIRSRRASVTRPGQDSRCGSDRHDCRVRDAPDHFGLLPRTRASAYPPASALGALPRLPSRCQWPGHEPGGVLVVGARIDRVRASDPPVLGVLSPARRSTALGFGHTLAASWVSLCQFDPLTGTARTLRL